MILSGLKLRVCHFPQVPCKQFIVEVKDEEAASLISQTLASQHFWLFQNNIIPDYSNAIMVEMFEDGEWTDYYNHAEMMDFDEFESTYLLSSIN